MADAEQISMMVISHDMGVIARLCADVLVMCDGDIVERGNTMRVIDSPEHPYTRKLIAAVPKLTDVAASE
jgi:peptide/nickel transport system ATP-binding protein